MTSVSEYTNMISTEKVGGGFLKFFKTIDVLLIFADGGVGEGQKVDHFL